MASCSDVLHVEVLVLRCAVNEAGLLWQLYLSPVQTHTKVNEWQACSITPCAALTWCDTQGCTWCDDHGLHTVHRKNWCCLRVQLELGSGKLTSDADALAPLASLFATGTSNSPGPQHECIIIDHFVYAGAKSRGLCALQGRDRLHSRHVCMSP